MTPTARAWRATALFALVPALVLALVTLLLAGPIFALVVLVVVGAALGAWSRLAGDQRVLTALGGRDANPKQDARLYNLVEGLTFGAGVKAPRLLVVDSPGLNAMAAGTSSSRALLAVTSGLLAELDRIELEAVLAEELVQIRRGEIVPGTVLAATFGIGSSLAVPVDRDAAADQGAVGLTRYPPALAAALEKIESKGGEVAGQPGYLAHLWLTDPRDPSAAARGRLSLRDRIEALREL